MSKKHYTTLGVDQHATQDEIKKAYRKLAMQYHPDKNKNSKDAEKKFKEINEAYQVLGDETSRKQYDTFGSAGFAGGAGGGNPFGGAGTGFSGFEDLFSQFGGAGGHGQQHVEFDFGDLFGNTHTRNTRTQAQEKEESLDFEKTYEVPIFDLILGCKIEVSGVYGQKAKLKIPAGTQPGSKFRVKDFGKSQSGKKGHLIVCIQSIMPKNISDVDMRMLETIRDNIGY